MGHQRGFWVTDKVIFVDLGGGYKDVRLSNLKSCTFAFCLCLYLCFIFN